MKRHNVKLTKKTDDPICMRASCGGDPEIGYYCVFRGDKNGVIKGLEAILEALKSNVKIEVDYD